ncbi:MAG: GNAT family N-acetyltransferase [Terracidiphilus sp.]
MPDIELLNNPMWSALTTAHGPLALGNRLARAYPPEIGPLSGLAEQTPAAYEDLRAIAEPDGVRVLFLKEPPQPRPEWAFVRGGLVDQMVHTGRRIDELLQPNGMRRLTKSDVPAMVELAKLTEPGPFRNRTHELGAFFGIFEGDRLLAMAGQRMRFPGFVEISAVCTHPDARGRGYARTLMSTVMELIRHEGDMPFLHTFADNYPAIRVYESLGFAKRCTFHLAVLKNES